MENFFIKSRAHDYEVRFEDSFANSVKGAADSQRNFLLADKKVYSLYPNAFKGLFDSQDTYLVEALESNKSYEALVPLFEWLLRQNFRKDCKLVVVGGGVTQDMGAFVANLLLRGVRWSLVPTTLLAQGDSCIGSKSSINFGSFKNQLGYFYPPHSVHLCYEVLGSLSEDDWNSGLGEIVKLAIIAGESSFRRAMDVFSDAQARKPVVMELIRDTLLIKKDFIERDELDVGPRRLLNFGHTFGHAYESATNYQIPHGVAVAIGMCNAAFVSQKLGMLPEQKFELIWSTLEPLTKKFHSKLFAIDMKTIASAIQRDKKNTSNKINCILLSGLGNLEIRPLSLNEDVLPLIEGFLSWIKAQDNQSRSLR